MEMRLDTVSEIIKDFYEAYDECYLGLLQKWVKWKNPKRVIQQNDLVYIPSKECKYSKHGEYHIAKVVKVETGPDEIPRRIHCQYRLLKDKTSKDYKGEGVIKTVIRDPHSICVLLPIAEQ